MFDADHYVPVLRAKQAEFHALRDAAGPVRAKITPLVELPPMAWDPDDEDGGASSPDPSLVGVARKLEQSWGTDLPFFLDLGLLPSDEAIGGGQHPVSFVFADTRTAGLQAVPVTSPSRDSEFQDAVEAAVAADGRGVCIRFDSDDFEDLEGAVTDTMSLLDGFGISAGDADLILDFGAVPPDQAGPLVLAATAVLTGIPNITDWRTLTWAGTSFPDVQPFQANSSNTAPRTDWTIYSSLRKRSLPRQPSFGDYTVNGVQTMYDVSARFYRSSPNVRYSTQNDYLVLKARHPRHGHDQFNDLCRALVDRAEFRGAAFSLGDTYIQDCADGSAGPGNAATWRRAGVSHHLAEVGDQIANLP